MRLVNHLYTRREVKISEGLGEGRDTWNQSREGGLLLSISMAGGESKVARLHETPAKKSRKRKPPKNKFWPIRGPGIGTLRRIETGAQSIG